MLNNIGLSGLLVLFLLVILPIWLIIRSSKRKAQQQARIADALEEIAKSKKNAGDGR
jgi:cbb3-type cytochrome oxidase subunit 3